MPLYLDLHKIQNKAKEANGFIPVGDPLKNYKGCRCLSSWLDLQNNHYVRLLDAPGETELKKHLISQPGESHEILPVNSKVAEVFLERLHQYNVKLGKLKSSYRNFKDEKAIKVLLVINTADSFLLRHQLGEGEYSSFYEKSQKIIKDLFSQFQGKQVCRLDNFSVASFISVFDALRCAIKIKKKISSILHVEKFEVVLIPDNASELPDPVSEFHFHSATRSEIIVASQVKNMCGSSVEKIQEKEPDLYWLTIREEKLITLLLQVMNQNWQNPNFNCWEFSKKISMSKSSLYRKCTAITGRSPNSLIKEYRLLRSLRLLKSGVSITRTCYDTGFNSPSYFCHCFQKHFNIRPGFYKKLCAA